MSTCSRVSAKAPTGSTGPASGDGLPAGCSVCDVGVTTAARTAPLAPPLPPPPPPLFSSSELRLASEARCLAPRRREAKPRASPSVPPCKLPLLLRRRPMSQSATRRQIWLPAVSPGCGLRQLMCSCFHRCMCRCQPLQPFAAAENPATSSADGTAKLVLETREIFKTTPKSDVPWWVHACTRVGLEIRILRICSAALPPLSCRPGQMQKRFSSALSPPRIIRPGSAIAVAAVAPLRVLSQQSSANAQ